MNGHTRGPWYLSPSGRYVRYGRDTANIADLAVFGGPIDELDANARLVIAAPDLYDACLQALKEDSGGNGGFLGLARRKIERALCKADGSPEPQWSYPDEAVPE